MKIQRPSPGRMVLVYSKKTPAARTDRPVVCVVMDVAENNPELIQVCPFPSPQHPTHLHIAFWVSWTPHPTDTTWWRYPPREDRTIEVPEEV